MADKCQKAFEKIKKIRTSDLSLGHCDPKAGIILASDASVYGIGTVIMQIYDDGNMKAFTLVSRSLLHAMINYSQIEKEALAIIFEIKIFHKFMHVRIFSLQTERRHLLLNYGYKRFHTHTMNRLQKLGYDDDTSRLIPKN